MYKRQGFLIASRRLAPGVTPPLRKRRPAKGAYDADPTELSDLLDPADLAQELGERPVSDKKLRRLRRTAQGIADGTPGAVPPAPGEAPGRDEAPGEAR